MRECPVLFRTIHSGLHLVRRRPGLVEEGADMQQRSVRVGRVYRGNGDAPLAGRGLAAPAARSAGSGMPAQTGQG